MSETFYRKYRPQTFADVVGQKHMVTTLKNALSLGRLGHAYLFTGPRGTGKTTLARIFSKAINCLDRKKNDSEPCGKCEHCILMAEGRTFDVLEIDAASHTGVDNIRELRETVTLPPTLGSHKIYIIDEVHMLSPGAFNALLKTLEEPPTHVIFILATTALHKVPDTIVSRTQRFDLSRFPIESIVEKLQKIARAEKIKVEAEALEMIALSAEGGMRDAESLFMQVASLAAGLVTAEKTTEVLGTARKESIFVLLELISQRKLSGSLLFIRSLSLEGKDLFIFGGGLLSTLRDLLLACVKGSDDASFQGYSIENKKRLLATAGIFFPDEIVRMLEHIQKAVRDTKNAFIEELPLEIAIVKILSENSGDLRPQDSSSARPVQKETSSNAAKSISSVKKAEHSTTSVPEAKTGTLEEKKVRELWPEILQEVKRRNASIFVALSQSKLLKVEDAKITLCVKYAFHKERLEDKSYQQILFDAFEQILGARVRLQVIKEETPVVEKLSQKPAHPLLNQALEMLGGRIVTETP